MKALWLEIADCVYSVNDDVGRGEPSRLPTDTFGRACHACHGCTAVLAAAYPDHQVC